MRRRRFLGVLGGAASLAGCSTPDATVRTEVQTLTPVDVPATETDMPTPASTTGSTEPFGSQGPFGEASVVNLKTGPRTLALSPVRYERADLQVAIRFVSTATITQPARLELTLTNPTATTTSVDLSTVPPLGRVLRPVERLDPPSTEASTGRLVVPTDGDLRTERTRIERGPEGYWRAGVAPPALPDAVDIPAGETRDAALLLLGEPDARGFPRGRYDIAGESVPPTLAAWDTGAPGPSGESRFADSEVPTLPNTTRTDWYHEATTRTGIFLRPSVERGGSPTTFRFTLVNHTVDPLGGNPEHWKLFKLVDGRWHRIAPWTVELASGPLPPGGTFEYVVAAAHDTAADCDCTATGGAVGHLGEGLYALEAGYSRVRTAETYAAMFRFDAPELGVEPTGEATVDHRGGTTVVTRPEWGGDSEDDATMTVRRARSVSATRLLPEQVYRRPYRVLRDVVPFLSDVPVVLRSDERLLRGFVGRSATSRRFCFDGACYVAELESAGADGDSTTETG